MTELQLYDAALIEQNKHEAPTLLIEEYNYLINKAIIQYTNLTYARFDLNQQASDDLRWLQRSVELEVYKQNKIIHPGEEANYVTILPSDYFHILNCTAHFKRKCSDDDKRCVIPDDDSLGGINSLCRRLTANQFPDIINNAYLKPTYQRPYFYINTSLDAGKLSTELGLKNLLDPCDISDCSSPTWKNEIQAVLKPCCTDERCGCTDGCTVDGDCAGTLMEIRCGRNRFYSPDVVYVDYLKLPKIIQLTWEDVNSVGDTTDLCEFPDPVAYEIINIFMKLLFENAGDQRLQTHFAINQTIGGLPADSGK